MSTFRKSVPKPAPGAGAPKGKNPFLKVVHVADILQFPAYDVNGVRMVGNLVLKTGAKVETLYLTDDTQKVSFTTEGESDAEGFLKKIEGKHPGDLLEKSEFVQNMIGEPLILIYDAGCGDNEKRVLGTTCNPMYLKAELTDDKDGLGTMFVFEQRMRDRRVPSFYSGIITTTPNIVSVSSALNVSIPNGNIYTLPANDGADIDITFESFQSVHGTILSIVGSGGDNPIVLNSGEIAPVNIFLRNGTPWVALEGAVINFEVFATGVTGWYLMEISRT